METQAIINLLSPIKDNIAKTAKMSLNAVFKWFWIHLCSFFKICHVLKLLCEVHWYIGLFFLLTASKRPYKISVPIILQHLLKRPSLFAETGTVENEAVEKHRALCGKWSRWKISTSFLFIPQLRSSKTLDKFVRTTMRLLNLFVFNIFLFFCFDLVVTLTNNWFDLILQ